MNKENRPIQESVKEKSGKNQKCWKKKGIQHWQVIALLMALYDVVVSNSSYLFGLWARFDFHYSKIPLIKKSAFKICNNLILKDAGC